MLSFGYLSFYQIKVLLKVSNRSWFSGMCDVLFNGDMFGHCGALCFAVTDKLISVKKTLTNFLFLFCKSIN